MAVWSEAEFDAFVGARINVLVRLGFALTGDLGRGEDLVQAALVQLWLWGRRVASEDPERYVNHAMIKANLGRHRRRPEPLLGLTSAVGAPAGVDAGSEQVQAVRRRFGALARRQRTALALRYAVGLDDAEIAQAMGVSTGLVAALTSRGLAQLRAAAGAAETVAGAAGPVAGSVAGPVAAPGELLDQTVTLALTAPDGLWARPDAGLRLRAQAQLRGIRRAEATTAGVAAALALLLVAGWLVGIGDPQRSTGFAAGRSRSDPVYGPGTLDRPVEVVEVRSVRPAPCPTTSPGPGRRGGLVLNKDCFELDRRPVVTISRVADLRLVNTAPPAVGVVVTFTTTDAAAFGTFTANRVGVRVALVADGRIWATVEIHASPDARTVTIPLSGLEDARRLVRTLRSGAGPAAEPSPTR